VEGKFSTSKCASISQMCKSQPPRVGHLLFITFHLRASRYQLHWTIFGGDSSVCCQADRRTPSVCRVLLAPRVPTRSKLTVEILASDASYASRPNVCRPRQTRPMLRTLSVRRATDAV
jgi:hypothetical protein